MLSSQFYRSKDQKYHKNFWLHFHGASRAKTDLQNKHMIQLCVWLIF